MEHSQCSDEEAFDVFDTAGEDLALALGVSQAAHFAASGLFFSMQVSHVHSPATGLNLSPQDGVTMGASVEAGVALTVGFFATAALGFGASHATHFAAPGLLVSMQVSHVHSPDAGLNLSPQLAAGAGPADPAVEAGAVAAVAPELAGTAAGLGVSQAAHFTASDLLLSMQVSQVHWPAAGLNWSPQELATGGAAAGAGAGLELDAPGAPSNLSTRDSAAAAGTALLEVEPGDDFGADFDGDAATALGALKVKARSVSSSPRPLTSPAAVTGCGLAKEKPRASDAAAARLAALPTLETLGVELERLNGLMLPESGRVTSGRRSGDGGGSSTSTPREE